MVRVLLLATALSLAPAMAAASQQTFGKGDVVYRHVLSEPLPNMFGGKDIFGRKRQIGFVEVRYLGFSDGVAHFARRDIRVLSTETTMNALPFVINRGREPNGNERPPIVLPHGLGAEPTVKPLSDDETAIDIALSDDPVLIVDGRMLRVMEAAANHVTIDVPGR